MRTQTPFMVPGLMATLLVLAGIGSIPPVAAQEPAQQQQHQQAQPLRIPSEFADLAEEYADQKAKAVEDAQAKTFRNKRKRWAQQLREASNSLDSTLDRFDRIDNLVTVVEASDPDIPKVKAEIAARTDRAYQQAKTWADAEEVAAALPDAFANAITSKFGVKLDFGGGGGSQAELLPPQNTRTDDQGWVTDAINSNEAKGAGAAGGLALLLLLLKRQKEKDKEDQDKRNSKVSEDAAHRAWQRNQAVAASQAGGTGG